MKRSLAIFVLMVLGGTGVGEAWQPGESRSGVILDSQSQKPIPQTKVKAECRKREFHGSRIQRVLEATSDGTGAFSFDEAQLKGCDVLFVRAERDGYVRTELLDVRASIAAGTYESVPARIYLTPSAGARMQRLQYAYSMVPGNVMKDGKISPEWSYRALAGALQCSRRIAEALEEEDFIRLNYCPRFFRIEGQVDSELLEHDARAIPYGCGDVGSFENISVPPPQEVHDFCQ